jgi:phenylalanyl-tRNA synthetase beta chain
VKNYLTSNNVASINNIVDIANLVMLETGQPLHVYDYDRLISQEIVVRNSQSGEVMADLKGQQRALNNGDLVISAENEIISLAGIIGSQSTVINNETTNILVESAFFSSHSIKKTVQCLNLSTPASQYFSKEYNLPFGNYALTRLIELIKEICPNAVEKNVISWAKEPRPKKKTVLISHEFIEKKLGIKLSSETIRELLKKLRFSFNQSVVNSQTE